MWERLVVYLKCRHQYLCNDNYVHCVRKDGRISQVALYKYNVQWPIISTPKNIALIGEKTNDMSTVLAHGESSSSVTVNPPAIWHGSSHNTTSWLGPIHAQPQLKWPHLNITVFWVSIQVHSMAHTLDTKPYIIYNTSTQYGTYIGYKGLHNIRQGSNVGTL